jgi:hypothetical protein
VKLRLVAIRWVDAYGDGGKWQDLSDATAGKVICKTVGWVVDESQEAIAVVQSLAINEDDDDAFHNYITIPKGIILEKIELPIPFTNDPE